MTRGKHVWLQAPVDPAEYTPTDGICGELRGDDGRDSREGSSTQPSLSVSTLTASCPPVLLVGMLLWAAWELGLCPLPDVRELREQGTQGAGWAGEGGDHRSRAALNLVHGGL